MVRCQKVLDPASKVHRIWVMPWEVGAQTDSADIESKLYALNSFFFFYLCTFLLPLVPLMWNEKSYAWVHECALVEMDFITSWPARISDQLIILKIECLEQEQGEWDTTHRYIPLILLSPLPHSHLPHVLDRFVCFVGVITSGQWVQACFPVHRKHA